MKIRTNFVSNSSSSSFIVGYGVLKPEIHKECLNLLKECAGDPNDWNGWNIKLANLIYLNEKLGFIDFPINTDGMDPIDIVLLVQIANDEGDDAFCNPPFYECEYDQAENIEFYSENQRKVIEILNSSKYIDVSKPHDFLIGAARNG